MKKPILYFKPTCGWCVEAINFFKTLPLEVELRDISQNSDFRTEMEEVSGQDLVPTLVVEGLVVADFSIEEFLEAVENDAELRSALGL